MSEANPKNKFNNHDDNYKAFHYFITPQYTVVHDQKLFKDLLLHRASCTCKS